MTTPPPRPLPVFLRIRERVAAEHQIILGVLPIIVIWFIWYVMTYGKMHSIILPEGTIDGNPPVVGQAVSERTYFRIPNAQLEQVETSPDSLESFVVTQNGRDSLGDMNAAKRDGALTVTLKEGQFVNRIKRPKPLPAENPEPAPPLIGSDSGTLSGSIPEEPKPAIGRGGVPIPVEPPPTVEIPGEPEEFVWIFKYEQVHTRWFNQTILPSPGDVVKALKAVFQEKDKEKRLDRNIFTSFVRVAKGFFAAFLLAFPLGILMGTFTKVRAMFSPLMVFGGYLPIPALVPLSMALFGLTETQKVMFLSLGFVIYLLPLFVRAIEEVDNVYLQTAYTLGANRWHVMTRVLLGIAWPNIYDAMRMGFGVGWGYIILAEMVDMGSGGVGASILVSQRRGLISSVYLTLLAIVCFAFITDKIWEKVGEWLFPYRSLKR
jgi:NitT/TauT family transport system permease protein